MAAPRLNAFSLLISIIAVAMRMPLKPKLSRKRLYYPDFLGRNMMIVVIAATNM
jgi:hypothetical protein